MFKYFLYKFINKNLNFLKNYVCSFLRLKIKQFNKFLLDITHKIIIAN